MASQSDLLHLTLTAYEAATEPARWGDFLEHYNEAVHAETTVLQIHDFRLKRSTVVASFGMSSPVTQSYNEYYSKVNVWRNHAESKSLYLPGAVFADDEICSKQVLRSSEFYNDYLKVAGMGHCLVGVMGRSDGRAPTVTALRPSNQDAFGPPESEVSRVLLPHLARAWTVHERLSVLTAGQSVLDNLHTGIVFLGSGGAVIYANRAAEEIFQANDGLFLRSGIVGAHDKGADAHMGDAIRRALSPGDPPREALAVPRPTGSRSYQVVAAPMRTRLRQFIGTSCPLAVVFIIDPARPGQTDPRHLTRLYGLTPREAAIMAKLSEAKSIRQVAEEMGITYETARTHLRRIFMKTQTSHQTELILLLARSFVPEAE